MSDNITGFGGSDEINLGLNLNSNVGNNINDFSTLDQVLQQMVKDQETFNGIQNDSFEKAKATTQEIRGSAEQAQQLINIFRALRGEQQGVLQDAKQFAAVYQQINNELQKASQTKTRLGITDPSQGVPGASSGNYSSSPTSSVPPTQAGSAGGGGGVPPTIVQQASYAEDPDDFFGREEVKSTTGRRKSKGIDLNNLDINAWTDLEDGEDTPETSPTSGAKRSGANRRRTGGGAGSYKSISDMTLALFPGNGYYRHLRRARWLARNEGSAIGKFTNSKLGERVGLAFNRLGGGQSLRTPQGYQLFPFAQNEKGDYIDENNNIIAPSGSSPMYGLRNVSGDFKDKWLPQGGEGGLETPWMWNGQGEMPPMPPSAGPNTSRFNPWESPNLNATGQGVAKIAGGIYAARVLKNKASNLFQEGQLYTGITGGTGVAGALKYDLGAQTTSWFGLNPLESYGQAKQITMQNLALGYRGNLLNRANEFGNTALQKYGVDPQTSMQMFGQMVMQAGVSLQDLQASLSTLAQTASTTNTSFSQLQQGVIQYSQLGSSIGLTGGQNATFATATAQFAMGQPGLQATGANPANILDSMVGQALVAQQMGTSYLGLPLAAQQQGAMGLTKGAVSVNESLMNRIGLNRGNFNNPTALANSYQKFKLLASTIPGMQHLANMSYANYVKYQHNLFTGAAQSRTTSTINSNYAQDVSGTTGGSPADALARSIGSSSKTFRGVTANVPSHIESEMMSIQQQQKWGNVGVHLNGKFMSLSEIDKLPAAKRAALMAEIGTGSLALSHTNKQGKWVQGNYSSGTLMDLQGHSADQFNEFGRTPNSAKMLNAEKRALRIELGPNAAKYLTLLEDPSGFNRHVTRWAKKHGITPPSVGNLRTGNNKSH